MENSSSFHLTAAVFIINQNEEKETEEHLVTAIKLKQVCNCFVFNSLYLSFMLIKYLCFQGILLDIVQ